MTEAKQKIMFDTNAFDKLLNVLDVFRSNANNFDFYITAIQVEELAKINDIKCETRIKNFLALCELRAILVPTSFVFDHTRLGFACFSDSSDNTYELLLNENKSDVNDALIGETAKREKCTLITDDTKFIKKLCKVDIPTMTFQEFYEKILQQSN